MAQPHILIVESRYYEDISDELFFGIKEELDKHDVIIDRIAVSGAFEIPAAISMMEKAQRNGHLPYDAPFDGYIALGCVIRGETSHYDTICQESARALQDLAVRKQLAISNAILTCETKEQAWIRASREHKNKGSSYAKTCLQMISLKRYLRYKNDDVDNTEAKIIY